MIYLKDIRGYLDRLLKKEQRGGVFSGDDFNQLLLMVNAEQFDSEKRKVEGTQDVTDNLKRFIKTVTGTTGNTVPTMGKYAIPSDYGKILSAKRLYAGSYRKADRVTQLEYEDMLSNSLTVPTDKNPVVVLGANNFEFDPNGYSYVSTVYLRKPNDPFLDFYFDANDEVQYLSEGQSYTLGVDEVYRDGTDSGTITSLTAELDWEDSDRAAIANRILAKMGIPAANQLAVELGMAETAKGEARV